jgi:chemotaxis regulatin CheY-phosphate phosphatase CheZ
MEPQIGGHPGHLAESQATLRQVEDVLDDFGGSNKPLDEVDRVITQLEGRPTGLKELVGILMRTYTEIMEVIESLRRSRGLLEEAAMERLKNTHEKLAEVSSATEVAATGMLDGLDRALVLVDHLEGASDEESEADSSNGYRNELRDELHMLMNLLQFQDITSQQLGYASTVLSDIEDRMVRLADVFDLREFGLEGVSEGLMAEIEGSAAPVAEAEEDHGTCDPEASTLNAEGRQALADEIFTVPGG